MMGKVYFVTGTDAEVGKTLVTASMILALSKRGIKAGGYKPLQSGVACWEDSDAGLLYSVSGYAEHPLTYSFSEAVAPAFAIKSTGQIVDQQSIDTQIDRLQDDLDILFVEGAGGWLVPYFPNKLVADWALELNEPVIVVGRATLGTINHTLLTVESIEKRQLQVAAVILSGAKEEQEQLAISNQKYIENMLPGIPVILLPWIEAKTKTEKIKFLAETEEIQLILNCLYC